MKAVFGAVQAWLLQVFWLDPDETAYAAHITVWTRWFLWVGAMTSLAFRPTFTYPQSILQAIPFLMSRAEQKRTSGSTLLMVDAYQ